MTRRLYKSAWREIGNPSDTWLRNIRGARSATRLLLWATVKTPWTQFRRRFSTRFRRSAVSIRSDSFTPGYTRFSETVASSCSPAARGLRWTAWRRLGLIFKNTISKIEIKSYNDGPSRLRQQSESLAHSQHR